MRKNITNSSIFIFLVIVYLAALTNFTQASNTRNWAEDQKILANINFATSSVQIENIKNFSYLNDDEKQKKLNYYSDNFSYEQIKNIWFFQNDFVGPLGAHTFLTFEFENSKYLSFSAEIRKEVGESYSPSKGLFNHYELQYILVSEKDILTLRAGLRQPPVFMYKLNLNRQEKINLFKDVLVRADKVNKFPEFYNTYNNACTTNIVDHLNKILEENKKPGNSWKIVFPKYSDEFLYKHGLIDTGLTFQEVKQTSQINREVREALKNNLDDKAFSEFIRQKYVENFRG